MSTYYVDYANGLDSYAGDSFAAGHPWKTIDKTSGVAAGSIIHIAKSPGPVGKGFATWTSLSKTVTLTAQTSVAFSDGGGGLILATKTGHNFSTGDVVTVSATTNYNGTYAVTVVNSSTFTFTKAYVSDQSGTVTPALTATISACDANWTVVNATSATAAATDWKEGTKKVSVVEDGTPTIDEVQAYWATGALDLSLFTKISFWIKNQVAVAANQLVLNLYASNDATGVAAYSFAIPAIPSTTRWLPLTISAGGAMTTGINSVALVNAHAGTYTASKYIYLDNIIACSTNGLNLQSLISKNGTARGGTEGFYGIQSISGNTILLDNDTNTIQTAGRGYSTSGTSPETVATYVRETIKTDMVASSSTAVQTFPVSGTAGSLVDYEGGYNTSNDSADGETFYDGLNGNGYGLYSSSKSFFKLNYLAVIRYNYGMLLSGGNNASIVNITNANNNTGVGISIGVINMCITTIANVVNNVTGGISVSTNNAISTIGNASNNLGYGVNFSSSNCSVGAITSARNNSTYGVSFATAGFDNTIYSLTTNSNATSALYTNMYGSNYFYKATFGETETSGFNDYVNGRIYSQQEDGTVGNNWIYTDGGYINSEAVTRGGASGLEWKLTITSANRASNYPLELSIAKIAVVANKLVTVTAYLTKGHATNVEGYILCKVGQIAWSDGTADVVSSAMAGNTNPQNMTITFTPTEAGVVEITGRAVYVTANGTLLIDTMTITQAA